MRLLGHVGVRLLPRRPKTVDGRSWSHIAASQRLAEPQKYLSVHHLCGSADVARSPLGGRACTTPAAHRQREGSSRIFRRVQDKEVEVADVIIIGAGAAGLTAAYFAAERHPGKVILLERTNEGGKKILMSGGSRCNVLPGSVDTTAGTDFFTESSGRALQAVLRSWSLDKCQDWLQRGVGLTLTFEPDDNKWFPSSNSAKQVRDQLVAACLDRGVSIRYSAFVSSLERHAVEDAGAAMGGSSSQDQPLWCCWLGGETHAGVAAHQVVVATGGLSFPAVGTDGTGHRILTRLGHSLHATYPALTPLTGSHPGGASLAGVSVYSVDLKCTSGPGVSRKGRSAERHGFLFTHKGYSGPSVLDLSHHAVMALECADGTASTSASPAVLEANWAGKSEEDWRSTIAQASGKAYVVNILARNLPQRLADALAAEAGLPPQRRTAELRKEERQRLLQLLTRYRLPVSGHQGYRKAEVTGGGVPLSELNCSTMESKVLPGIFLCGEIVDVFGRIGGFNFYWAWVSGRLAGLSAAAAACSARS